MASPIDTRQCARRRARGDVIPARAAGFLAAIAAGIAACATPPPPDRLAIEQQVRATEEAFAATMAARDFAAFRTFLSEEAVFVQGKDTLRGRQQVSEAWRAYFDGEAAPFSWRPTLVSALDSGQLALSTGPVLDPSGRCIGTFTSIWRRARTGAWRIVFDRGSADCPDP